MARFYLGKDTAGKDLWGEGKYPYVDLRGKIPGNPQPNQGTVYKDSGVIWHWNGPKVVHKDLDQLAIDARYHMRPDAFGPGATPNGIQYEWAIGHDGTKYRLRNPGASLWHCGNTHHNVKSFAATFLIGEGQRITAAAKESARELTDALLKIQGLGREACRGHRDVNPSTCPGTAYADFVLPYRAGSLTPAPKPPTAPPRSDRPELVYALASNAPDVAVARAAVTALKTSSFPKAYVMSTPHDLSEASRKALNSPARPALLIGGPTVPKLHPDARRAFENGERDRLLNCVGDGLSQTKEMLAWRLKALSERAGLDVIKVLTTYRAELEDAPPVPAKPAPKPPTKKPDALERMVEEAIAFGRQLIGAPYGVGWEEGTWPDLSPLYARIGRHDPPSYYRARRIICSGLVNVLRYEIAGLPAVGRAQGDSYPGGTAAIGRRLARMPGCRPYPPVENTPRGWLVFSPYLGSRLALQGHVGVALGDGRVLEARVPAVSDNRTEDEGHRHLINNGGRGYTTIIPPSAWLKV